MARFNPTRSILAGMDPVALQARLAALQQAYLDLSSGAKVVNLSYAQGDGSKSVTYKSADLPALTQAIQLVQAQLGIVDRPRAAFGVRFGPRP